MTFRVAGSSVGGGHAPRVSPCPWWAGTADWLTVIVCTFPGFPGGRWQIVTCCSGANTGATKPLSAANNTADVIIAVIKDTFWFVHYVLPYNI
jgi:hypothetical protein